MITAAVEIDSHPPGSARWSEQRRRSLGGSEIAAVLGVSAYDSMFSLWHEKAGSVVHLVDNDEVRWGNLLEPGILDYWLARQDEMPATSVRGSVWRNVERPWQIASPDLLVPGALVEAKTSRYGEGFGEEGTDQVPPGYLAQTRWYMDALGLDVAHLALLVAGSEFREYLIRPDDGDTALMRKAGAAFVDSLPGGQAESRPDIDEHSATYWTIRELHPDIDGDTIELDPELARGFCKSRHELAAAEGSAQGWRSRVADAMGDAQHATFLDSKIARREARNGGRPYVVAARNLPEFTEDTEMQA